MAGKHKGLWWKITLFMAVMALVYAASMLFIMINEFRFTDLPGFLSIYAAVGIYGTQMVIGLTMSLILFVAAFILQKYRK